MRAWAVDGPSLGVDTAHLVREIDRDLSRRYLVVRLVTRLIVEWEIVLYGSTRKSRWWLPRVPPILPERLLGLDRGRKFLTVNGKKRTVRDAEQDFEDPTLQILLQQDRKTFGTLFALTLGIDPGEHTGFALLKGSQVLWLRTAYGERAVWDTLAFLLREYDFGPPDGIPIRVALERFLGFQFLSKERLGSMRAEAAARLFCEITGLPVTLQTSAQIEAYGHSRVKMLTGTVPRTEHEKDAIAHALYAQGIFAKQKEAKIARSLDVLRNAGDTGVSASTV